MSALGSGLLVAVGGGLGSLARYGLSHWLTQHPPLAIARLLGDGFPVGTFGVNFLGSFIIGVFWMWWQSRFPGAEGLRLFLMVGFLGGFTTFSTFSLDSLQLINNGQAGLALIYILLSVVMCLAGVWLGVWGVKAWSS